MHKQSAASSQTQTLQSFDDRIEILARELELAVKWQRPCLLLLVYSSEYVRAEAQTALENYLIDLGQKTAILKTADSDSVSAVQFLREFRDPSNTVYFVEGLRWGYGKQVNKYVSLNLQQEFFVERQVRVIFWLTPNEMVDLAHYAPDFWSRRNRVIEFTESPKPEQVLQEAVESAWQGTGEYADQFDDTDAGITLRESLLKDLPNTEEASFARANLLLTLGILNWRKGNYEKADEQLREAIKAAAMIQDNWFEAECFNAIALVKTSMKRSEEAIDAYKQAIRLAPEQIFAWNNLGNLCAMINRNDEAMAAFLKAVECNPKDPIAWNGLGNVYSKIGYVDDAIAAYRKSIRYMPTFAHPWAGLGDVYAGTGRTDEALKSYQRAIELNDQYVTPWLRMGALFANQEKYRDAVKAYQRALQLDSRNSAIWNELGTIYLKYEAHEEAVDALSKAIELDRGHGWAHSNLALAYAQLGRYEESAALYLKSIELLKDDEDKAVAWNRLANTYRLLCDYDNAIAAYQMADMLEMKTSPQKEAANELKAAPESRDASPSEQSDVNAEPVFLVAAPKAETRGPLTDAGNEPASELAALKISDAPEWIFNSYIPSPAESLFAPGIKNAIAPPNGEAGFFFSNAAPQEAKGDNMPKDLMDNDLPDLEETKAESMDPNLWNEKGNIHFKQGAFDEAISAYNKAIRLDPTLGWPYCNLALTYLNQGQYAEAILLYQKSLELLKTDEDKAVSWNGLGNIYRCINDYANAVAAYQKAAELDPKTAGMRDGADTFQAGQSPKNPETWNNLGELFFKSGAYDDAVHSFKMAIELDPEAGWPYSNLARVLAARGQYAEAVPLYQKGIELLKDDKDKAVVWNRLGNAYRKLNDYDSAIKAYQKAVILADEGVSLLTRTRFSLLSNSFASQ